MAEKSAMNSDNKVEQRDGNEAGKEGILSIKKEVDVLVKQEALECAVCVTRSHECYDMTSTTTNTSGATLQQFLSKYTNVNIGGLDNLSKFVCKNCVELINVLEQAEIEYNKLKETFEAIISKNPFFDGSTAHAIRIASIKSEGGNKAMIDDKVEEDSEDEPLAKTKKKRRRTVEKRKKTTVSTARKRKPRSKTDNEDDSRWECNQCGVTGDTGGSVAEEAHKLTVHTIVNNKETVLKEVKTEDGSRSPFNNGFDDNCLSFVFGEFDDDDSSNFVPDELSNGSNKSNKKLKITSQRTKTKRIVGKKKKEMHPCDQCDAKYSSLARLEAHKQKHDGSKPPYICEVCGAHYKHKRACDIHIAMHKGISDWKCDECNKLFPSKNALQRHNNIHTGKLNYQCDLCGKSFIHTSSFKMHKLSHSGVKPHSCDVCGLALMTRSHLKRHKRVHSGEKRHECAVCGKRFSERYNLAAHSKAHEDAAPRPPDARRRLFRCTFCPERFERRYMLERHTSVVHGRTLERPPPTPRNTMSKLLKAQAQSRRDVATPPESDLKDDRSSDSRSTQLTPQKLIAQLSASTSIITSNSWSGAYAAEFGLRHDYPH